MLDRIMVEFVLMCFGFLQRRAVAGVRVDACLSGEVSGEDRRAEGLVGHPMGLRQMMGSKVFGESSRGHPESPSPVRDGESSRGHPESPSPVREDVCDPSP
ncbi:hypothetical protein Dimus_033012 [Dionaea muscipula]